VPTDIGGAVAGQGIVPFGAVFQPIHLTQIVKKYFALRFEPRLQPVEINVLVAVVRAQAHHVALIGDHVGQFVLPEEALETGVFFTDFLTGFYGNTEIAVAVKTKAEHGVRNQG